MIGYSENVGGISKSENVTTSCSVDIDQFTNRRQQFSTECVVVVVVGFEYAIWTNLDLIVVLSESTYYLNVTSPVDIHPMVRI